MLEQSAGLPEEN